ncbi:MAG: SAM-dependent methyltransferase [Chitinophagaceae bacterium]|nr:SAM-dependent methyltransferase [Chitinophagaceae bacterium]
MKNTVYLIPSVLDEAATNTIPLYIIDAVKNCQVIFAENERTTRRFLKSICKEIVIDAFEWFTIHKTEEAQINIFKQALSAGKNIAIISEAGCPGIADPGQILIAVAQEMGVTVKPLVGPSSILLALMASGMNGQSFEFLGYLPIDNNDRIRKIKELEQSSKKNNSTKIFIETPYRNNQLIETVLKNCLPATRFCIASQLTAANEYVQTKKIQDWKKQTIDFHKKPVIFLLSA